MSLTGFYTKDEPKIGTKDAIAGFKLKKMFNILYTTLIPTVINNNFVF